MLTMSFGVVPSAPEANCNVHREPEEGEEPGCEKSTRKDKNTWKKKKDQYQGEKYYDN